MSIINPGPLGSNQDTVEQMMAFINGLGGGNALAPLLSLVANAPNAPAFPTAVTLVSGTPSVNASGKKAKYFIGITGGASGTVGVTVTDLTPTVHTLIPVVAANAVASQQIQVDVPAGWSITVTTSVATINASTVIATGL